MGEELVNVHRPCPCPSGDCWDGQEWDLGLANPSMLSSTFMTCMNFCKISKSALSICGRPVTDACMVILGLVTSLYIW